MPAYTRPYDTLARASVTFHQTAVTLKMIDQEAEIAALQKENKRLRDALAEYIRSVKISNGYLEQAIR